MVCYLRCQLDSFRIGTAVTLSSHVVDGRDLVRVRYNEKIFVRALVLTIRKIPPTCDHVMWCVCVLSAVLHPVKCGHGCKPALTQIGTKDPAFYRRALMFLCVPL